VISFSMNNVKQSVEEEMILDYELDEVSSINWRHMGLFCLIQLTIGVIIYWLGADAKANTPKMNLISLSAFLIPACLTIIMIRTNRVKSRLKFRDKVIPILCLIATEFATAIFLNYERAFGRKITSGEFIVGLRVTSYSYLLIILPMCMLLGAIIKSRIANSLGKGIR
jgi:hypothetical protein